MKRYLLFFLTNILVMVSLSILYSVLVSFGLVPGGYFGNLMVFSLVIGMGGSIFSLLISRWMAKQAMGVRLVDERGPYGELVQTVYRIARKAGMTSMPEVGVYESPEVNAFATGPSQSKSLVAVSTGLLQRMDRDELEGVLAHEVAHITNGDMVTMTLVQGIMNAFAYFISIVVTNFIQNALRGDSNRGVGDNFFVRHLIFNLVYGLVSFAAFPIVAGFSRYREYRADAGGAKLAGRDKMTAALQRLQSNMDRIQSDEQSFQSMKISNKSSFAEWFSTHPPLEKRIRALQGRA
jgi:heat shock protein HtpX